MAVTLTNLAPIGENGAGSDLFTIWTYVTNDSLATVEAADYFLEAENMLRVGDWILCSGARDGTVVGFMLMVASNTGSTVTTKDFTTAGASGNPVTTAP